MVTDPGPIDGSRTDCVSTGRPGDTRLSPVLHALDEATTIVERPVRRLAGSARLNPLPHAGTTSVFLFGVVVVSGLYITLFFEYGHEASYRSVASMEAHAIQRVVRALHRYSSAALVLTSVIHGWRVLTAGRFIGGQRRLRWATGSAAVALVWLAGVTGYWLVWDVRAQALNEVVIGFVGGTGTGAGFAIDHLGVLGGRSGSGFVFVLWLVHLGLSAAVGFFLIRHLRRSKLPWLPPQHLMAVLAVGLVLVSLALPVGMLAPADPAGLIGTIPLDPFVLFLLPPLLSDARWAAMILALALFGVVLVLPRLLRRRDPAVIAIDEARCTGCELCVIDCPYQALTMRPSDHPVRDSSHDSSQGSPGGRTRDPALAVVDAARCVACGICLGSCTFEAITLPGTEPVPAPQLHGTDVVIACDRHGEDMGEVDDRRTLHLVGCAGAISPDGLKAFVDRGATSINVIGCAPNECRYGIGNTLASERLSGHRRPHPAARHARVVTQDWVATDHFTDAIRSPGSHPSADAGTAPGRREALLGVGAIAILTALGIAAATRTPFDAPAEEGSIRLVVDHGPGRPLQVGSGVRPVDGFTALEVAVDDGSKPLIVRNPDNDRRWTEIIDLNLDLDSSDEVDGLVTVDAVTGDGGRTEVHAAAAGPPTGTRLVIDLTDAPDAPTVADGRRIFSSRTGGCDTCHSLRPGDDGVGPSLAGVASEADDRVEGLTAEQYLRQSILLPDQYVVPGWPEGQMLPIYRDRLSEEELDAVVSFLLSLEKPETGEDS